MQDLIPIMDLIPTVGISAIFVLLMAYFVKYMYDKFMSLITELNLQHRKETAELTTAINNNTVVMEKILTALNVGSEVKNE